MRVRAQTATGDYAFGRGSANYLVNSPAAVAQLVLTALRLWAGEWFVDLTAGVDYLHNVLSANRLNTTLLYDIAIRSTVLGVQGVTGIVSYSSSLDRGSRQLSVTARVQTQFSADPVAIETTIEIPPVP